MFIPISLLWLSWVLSSQFYRFLRLQSSFFVSQIVSLIALLKNKGYPLKILLKRNRGLLNEENYFCGTLSILSHSEHSNPIMYRLVSGDLFETHLVSSCCMLFYVLSSYCACTLLCFCFSPYAFLCVFFSFYLASCQPLSWLSLFVASGLEMKVTTQAYI